MPRFCAHLGYQFTEVPPMERFAAAAGAGFEAIEFPAPFPHPATELQAALQANGLRYIQFALPLGDAAAKEKGFVCHPGRERELDEGIARAVGYAKTLDCRLVHAMSGVVPPGVTRGEAMRTYLANLAHVADRMADHGIDVLVEAISAEAVPGYLVDRPSVALQILEECGRPNVYFLLDTYHAAATGEDPVAQVRDHLPRIAHVQIADYPGRHEPGTGRLDFRNFFRALDELDYQGWVGCEYVPAARTEAGLGWLDPYR